MEIQFDIIEQALRSIIRAVGQAIPAFQGLPDWPKDRSGGYFCLADGAGVPIIIVKVGEPSIEKREKYRQFCIEKAARLAQFEGHQSSWQSRDPDYDMWGGAVRIKKNDDEFIFSFSGFPELADEALMLLTAHVFFGHDAQVIGPKLYEIARISSNFYWGAIREG